MLYAQQKRSANRASPSLNPALQSNLVFVDASWNNPEWQYEGKIVAYQTFSVIHTNESMCCVLHLWRFVSYTPIERNFIEIVRCHQSQRTPYAIFLVLEKNCKVIWFDRSNVVDTRLLLLLLVFFDVILHWMCSFMQALYSVCVCVPFFVISVSRSIRLPRINLNHNKNSFFLFTCLHVSCLHLSMLAISQKWTTKNFDFFFVCAELFFVDTTKYQKFSWRYSEWCYILVRRCLFELNSVR